MKLLEEACHRRFHVTGPLTFKQMTDLIQPPTNPILLEKGKFRITVDHNKDNYTQSNGAQIKGDCYVPFAYYSIEKKLLDNPATRKNLTIRAYFDVVETDGSVVKWQVEGGGNPTSWNPKTESISEYKVPTGLYVDEHNSLQFSTTGNTTINLDNSYVEIIVEGEEKDNDNTVTPRTILKAISYGVAPKTESIVNVKDKGAKGDGSSDDTVPIQTALDEVKKVGGIVYVPAGTYMIKAHDPEDLLNGWQQMTRPAGLKIGSNTTLLLDENATIKAIPNNASGYSILHVGYANDVNIVGGTIEGDKYTHILDTPFNQRNGENFYGEWGDGAVLYGSNNVKIHGVTFKHCWGDGIDVYPPIKDKNNGTLSQVHNLSVQNCVFDDNRRQGMSLEHLDGAIIENNLFQNTNGTAPAAGLDIEPGDGSSESVTNVTVKNNTFINNTHQAITLYASRGCLVDMITIDGNTLIDNGNWTDGQLDINNVSRIDIRNNKIISHDGSRNFGIYVIASQEVKISNNYLPNGNIILSDREPYVGKASGTVIANFAANIESNNPGYNIDINFLPVQASGDNLKSIGASDEKTAKITHPNVITNESLRFYDFISWGRKFNPNDNPDNVVLENNAPLSWKGDFSFDIDAKLLKRKGNIDDVIHFEKSMFELQQTPGDQASLTDNPLYLGTMGLPIKINDQEVGKLYSNYIIPNGTFNGEGSQHIVVSGINFGDSRLHTDNINNISQSKTVIATADGKKYAYSFKGANDSQSDSKKGTMIIPQGSLKLSLGASNHDGTVTLGKDDWANINGLSINDKEALRLAKDSSKSVKLHLNVSRMQNSGIAWLKWNDLNNNSQFTPKLGDNIIDVPSSEGEPIFSLVVHPFFDSITIDTSKSYVEVVDK